MAAARGKRSQKHHFLSISEVMLGIFEVQFLGFSVLQRHGVLLPGGDFFPCCFPIWGPDVKVAKCHSSSKRKKEPKASFSIGSPCQNDANAADHGIPWAPRHAATLNIEKPLINGRTAVEQNQLNRKTNRQS